MSKYLDLSIVEINKLLKDKTIKPLDLVLEAFARIEATNESIFITLDKEKAIEKAISLEDKEVDNIFFGIPVVVNDNIATAGIKTTCASKMLEDFVPIYDASVIETIKEKNAIIIGKGNIDEFGNCITNGAGDAVGKKISPIGISADLCGNISFSAVANQLVGMKPTYGRVSRYGLISYASSLEQIGILSNNVYDNASFLNVISGYDPKDLNTYNKDEDFTRLIDEDFKGIKIAIPNFIVNKKNKDQINKIEELLKKKGITLDYIDIDYSDYITPVYMTISAGELYTNLAKYDGVAFGHRTKDASNWNELYSKSRSEGFGDEIKTTLLLASLLLSGKNAYLYYEKALKVRRKIKEELDDVFKNYDFIISPINQDNKASYEFAVIPSLTGLPSMTLPIGIEIIGNAFEEAKMYQFASIIEKDK